MFEQVTKKTLSDISERIKDDTEINNEEINRKINNVDKKIDNIHSLVRTKFTYDDENETLVISEKVSDKKK